MVTQTTRPRSFPFLDAERAGSAVSALPDFQANTANGTVASASLLTVAAGNRGNLHLQTSAQAIPTGIPIFDQWIGNGFKPGELILIGGAPGVGKTTLCLQIARNIAQSGDAHVLYACYEHQAEYLLDRLITQETIDPAAPASKDGLTLDDLHQLMAWASNKFPDDPVLQSLARHPATRQAVDRFLTYAGNFHVVADAPRQNSVDVLEALITEHRTKTDAPMILFVDYLQKIESSHLADASEVDKVTDVVQRLKQLALEYKISVVAIAASDKAGIQSPRLRFSHFRGSSALMYEADVALIMNDKWQIVDRERLVFNQHKAAQYRDWVVCTIEKNRAGRNLLEFELRKRFEHCCFDPNGGHVSERLFEERIQGEQSIGGIP